MGKERLVGIAARVFLKENILRLFSAFLEAREFYQI